MTAAREEKYKKSLAVNSKFSWRQSEKGEHGCTTTKLHLSNDIKIVSVLYCNGRTNSDVQKRDGQTNKKKFNVYIPKFSKNFSKIFSFGGPDALYHYLCTDGVKVGTDECAQCCR